MILMQGSELDASIPLEWLEQDAVSPVELVKQCKVKINRTVLRKARLNAIRTNSYDGVDYCLSKLVSLSPWVVDIKFVRQFEYHANIGKYAGVENTGGAKVQYAGDIPEFAMDNLEKALGITNYVTIHSNYPFPVEYQLPKTDPVLVAWEGNPGITMYSKKGSRGMKKMNKTRGVVIAIWDYDKEIEIK